MTLSAEGSRAGRPVVWGLLSTARINDLILHAAEGSDKLEIRAVASRSREKAERYAAAKGIPKGYGSYEELLADSEIEVVYISLPNALHIDWTIQALRSGKHVLCEKPLSPRPQEVENAFAESVQNERLLMEGYMFRHHPQLGRINELLEAGTIGELRMIRASFSFPADPVADAHLLAGPDGGSLLDVGCYCVSLSRFLAGEPESVYAEQIEVAGVDRRFAATLRCQNGLISQFDSALDLPQRETLELVGERGTITLSDPWAQGKEARITITGDNGSDHISLGRIDAYRLEIDNFADATRGASKPYLTADDAIGNARTLQALLRAAADRRPVTMESGASLS